METKTTIEKKVVDYHLKGLSYKEISKLLDISPCTVQRCIKENGCKEQKEPTNLQQKAFEMHIQGFSYTQIAKKLNVSKTTIYLWHKKQKEYKTKSEKQYEN